MSLIKCRRKLDHYISDIFAIGTATVTLPGVDDTLRIVSGTGELTLKNAYIKGFKTKGGDGADANINPPSTF